jgi:hypothetical protein
MSVVVRVDFVRRKRVADVEVELQRARECNAANVCPRCYRPIDASALLAIIPEHGIAYHVSCYRGQVQR